MPESLNPVKECIVGLTPEPHYIILRLRVIGEYSRAQCFYAKVKAQGEVGGMLYMGVCR